MRRNNEKDKVSTRSRKVGIRVLKKCDGCEEEFEIVPEEGYSSIDWNIDTIDCPYCGKKYEMNIIIKKEDGDGSYEK